MLQQAKDALDKIIRKGRIHLYKPIQIAEILHYHRLKKAPLDIERIDTYRNSSKKWRDIVTMRLVGNVSTSSQRYQDNLFDKNAMPPVYLKSLAEFNASSNGLVEAYIYYKFKQRQQDVIDAFLYLTHTNNITFSLNEFLSFFEKRSGLKRSVDKAFEIVVYALFSTLIQQLGAQISLSLLNPDREILSDFSNFVEYVLGLSPGQKSVTMPAAMYRGGVANAADRGLDIVTNYGPAVQVKHLSLNENLAGEIVENVAMSDIVIVCKTAEAGVIRSLLGQMGLGIRGIITQSDLETWYDLCQTKYGSQMGKLIIDQLITEFEQEFPMLNQLDTFLIERQYDQIDFRPPFNIKG